MNRSRTIRGKHALSAHRITRGEYSVHFDSDVSNCAFLATIGATGATPVVDPGTISVASGKKPHNVFVTTVGRSGSVANFPFHLAANCGTTPFRAVVKANGTTARGRGTTSSQHLGPNGEYEVAFTQDVTMCSFVATIGGPGTGITTLPLTITGSISWPAAEPQAARSRAARIASASSRTPGSTAGSGRWP